MTFHMPAGRLIAQGGPVTNAIRAMREALDLPPLVLEQFERERGEIDGLRAAIKRQIEADFDRIDRCLVVLDTLSGDDELEAEYTTIERGPDGGLYTLGRSTDDEPSLCGTSVSWPSQPSLYNCGDDSIDIELVDSDDEDSHDAEGMTDDNGIADALGLAEQGFGRYDGARS